MSETRRLRCDGLTVAYAETGTGPPVVFLHGAGLTHRLWEPQLEALGGRFRCIAPDLRGHGATVAEDGPSVYTADLYARDLRSFLDALGVDRAHVVGLSLGGMVAQEFGLRHPERVRSLVTIGTPNDLGSFWLHRAMLSLLTRYLLWRLRRGGMAWVARAAARWMARRPQTRAYLLQDCPRNSPEEFERVWRGVVRYAVRHRLPDLEVPVLVIAADRDPNRRQALAGAGLIRGARFELVRGAGHITNRDAPEAVNRLLLQWLQARS